MVDNDEIKFSPNSAIDTSIKKMLPSFDPNSQRRMKKAIINAKKSAEKHRDENTDASARHIFREFIPAYVLNQRGFSFEYEKPIQGKTPDWLDVKAKLVLESYTCERGGSSKPIDRITLSIADKYNKYKELLMENSLKLIVAVYLDFYSEISLDECRENSAIFRTVFPDNDSLWSIIFFTETKVVGGQQYHGFYFFTNCGSYSTELPI